MLARNVRVKSIWTHSGGQALTEGQSLKQALFLFQFQLKSVGGGGLPPFCPPGSPAPTALRWSWENRGQRQINAVAATSKTKFWGHHFTYGRQNVSAHTYLAVKSTLEFQALYLICFGVCYKAVNTERAGVQLKIDDSHYSRGSWWKKRVQMSYLWLLISVHPMPT